ncbi:porin family protein [Alsobacter sp. SYSU M60028]|uniref:Porin family protein n=1 Tax=Alsobacter ponti TaxID=2962936 RepID=A0ABT1LF31_9HYPH|nr:outer membrane protein [Alsobacter ponti]MCP8940102.1 porin family protein [Alsobacter ponti]
MRRILLASAMSLAALPAFAADLPARTAPIAPAPVMAPMYNWTGFYVGANAGYAWGSGDLTFINFPTTELGSGMSLDNDGFTAGVQVGYNYQINQFVLGVEADANWVEGSDKRTVLGPTLTAYGTSKVEWLSTIRARLGFAVNNFLIYGTGGFAFGQGKATLTIADAEGTQWSGSQSGTRTGWTLGAGVEYAFTRNWTARVEYLYYDLGDKTFYAPQSTAAVKADFNGNIIRAGVNYKF